MVHCFTFYRIKRAAADCFIDGTAQAMWIELRVRQCLLPFKDVDEENWKQALFENYYSAVQAKNAAGG